MRKIYNFDQDWRYHAETPSDHVQSDGYGPMYVSAKTERIKSGPAAYHHFDVANSWDFDHEIPPEKWQNVTLPHDYIIRQTPDETKGSSGGFFDYHNAWYRKHFRVDETMRGKRITLLFDAISGNSTIWLNGCLIRYNHCAYTPIEADISDYVYFDRENVVSVYIDMSLIEGWWYRGAGIYRHTKLIVTDPLCVDLYGDYIFPIHINDDVWQVPIETSVRNDRYQDMSVELVHKIYDKNGSVCAEYSVNGIAKAREIAQIKTVGEFSNPQLWDIDSPVLYTLLTEVRSNGKVYDLYETTFGFRTAEFDANSGFKLNGRTVKIKGVCAHQDFGLTGLAVPDNIFDYKIRMIKEMGANGYRASHYPHPPETMDALDKYGFLVLDEIRHFDSNEESMKQIEMTVKRDRNHPSVIFWSTGNEELRYHNLEQGISIQRAMSAQVKKFDPFRPITSAVARPKQAKVLPYMDIIGINYVVDELESIHNEFPNKPIVSTENCATPTSVGNYTGNHPEYGLLDARDYKSDKTMGRAATWKVIADNDWICGGYQWDAFEHRGEAAFPKLCSASGAIDLYMRKKDAFYQNVSLWSAEPMVHLLPHWNYRGLEGRNICVWAYTNCSEVELYLNGTLIAKQPVPQYGHAEWEVPYAPGKLTAVGWKDGEAVVTETIQTSGEAYALRLCEETPYIHSQSNEMALISCSVVDRNGILVPDATPLVRFMADNGAVVSATGSANFDHTPPHHPERRMYAGNITVGVCAGAPGKTTVYAYSDGLLTAAIDINVLQKRSENDTISGKIIADRIEAGHV